MNPVVIGSTAPAFSLLSATGPITPEALHGSAYILYFYPKDDTSGCTTEAQEFSALRTEFEALHARVIGVSRDSLESHSKFQIKYGLQLTLATDPDGAACDLFGVWVEKSMYGRKYMGIERSTFLFDKQGVLRRNWRKVKVPGHAAEVLEALRQISI